MQVLAMSFFLLAFAVLGFLSPAQQGNLVTAFILLFVFMGSFAGYFSARLYKMFKGKAWKRNTFLTAFAFSGSLLTIAIFINFFVWAKKSSLSIPFVSILLLIGLWIGVCAPLVAVGAYYGFKADEIKHPVRVTNIPRQIPPQPWYLHPIPSILVGGILPFGTVFVELFFILSSIWLDQYYYVFGFLLLVFVLLLVTAAEISIMLTYFQLCAEDYQWWWRSMLVPAASGCYLYAYCIYYFLANLEMEGTVPQLLYFGYMGIVALLFSFVTGTTGYLATLWFVRKIYGAIRVD